MLSYQGLGQEGRVGSGGGEWGRGGGLPLEARVLLELLEKRLQAHTVRFEGDCVSGSQSEEA